MPTDISNVEDAVQDLLPVSVRSDTNILQTIRDSAAIVERKCGEYVFHVGDECRAFLFLIDGSIRVQLVSSGGREVTLYRIARGRSCMLTTSCLMSNESYPAEAIADTDIQALAIPLPAFEAMMESSSRFRWFVFQGRSDRLGSVIRRIQEISFSSVDSKLARRLLMLESTGTATVTHQKLSAELGTAREVVSRHLKQFEARGLVQLGRGKVTIVDRPGLVSLSSSIECD